MSPKARRLLRTVSLAALVATVAWHGRDSLRFAKLFVNILSGIDLSP